MTSFESLVSSISSTVLQKLGPCHRECIYRRAMVAELQRQNLFVQEEVDIPITYTIGPRKVVLGIERADIVINQSCILEIKCGNPKTSAVASALGQARRYLKYYDTSTAKVAFVVFLGESGAHQFLVKPQFDWPLAVKDKLEHDALAEHSKGL